jgi:hypothetical protein
VDFYAWEGLGGYVREISATVTIVLFILCFAACDTSKVASNAQQAPMEDPASKPYKMQRDNNINEKCTLLGLKHGLDNNKVRLLLLDYITMVDGIDFDSNRPMEQELTAMSDKFLNPKPIDFAYILKSLQRKYDLQPDKIASILLDYRIWREAESCKKDL